MPLQKIILVDCTSTSCIWLSFKSYTVLLLKRRNTQIKRIYIRLNVFALRIQIKIVLVLGWPEHSSNWYWLSWIINLAILLGTTNLIHRTYKNVILIIIRKNKLFGSSEHRHDNWRLNFPLIGHLILRIFHKTLLEKLLQSVSINCIYDWHCTLKCWTKFEYIQIWHDLLKHVKFRYPYKLQIVHVHNDRRHYFKIRRIYTTWQKFLNFGRGGQWQGNINV